MGQKYLWAKLSCYTRWRSNGLEAGLQRIGWRERGWYHPSWLQWIMGARVEWWNSVLRLPLVDVLYSEGITPVRTQACIKTKGKKEERKEKREAWQREKNEREIKKNEGNMEGITLLRWYHLAIILLTLILNYRFLLIASLVFI